MPSSTSRKLVQDPIPSLESRSEGPVISFVDEHGAATPAGEQYGIDIDQAKRLYRDMLLARTLDSEALALQRQGELNLWVGSGGQEAAQIGSIRALRDSDMVFPSYREHAAAMARRVTPTELLSQWRGATHSGWDSVEKHFHIYSLVLGTQTLHAAGFAEGVRMDGADDVVAVYFGDGAASQGDVNESFNWCAARSLPVLFVCQNNQWAISTPVSQQSRTSVAQRATGFGIPSWHVDGNDVLAMYAVTSRAAELIRAGGGPALIEAETYRLGGHSSSDDPTRYRDVEQVQAWTKRDPLLRIERLLSDRGVDPGFFTELRAESDGFASDLREACKAIEDPDLDRLFENVYAEAHAPLREQRESHRSLLIELGEEAVR